MSWSPQQEAAIKAVRGWLRDPYSQVFYLAGFAGTGKTTLAKTLAKDVRGRVMFGAFTGKASLVLQKKGCAGASTIHSMIYVVDDDARGWEPKFRRNHESEVKDAALVIIDECSMVGEELGRDLLSFGTKVLVLGDPAQLPPVKDAGFFTKRQPDVMLTEVHRQAAENPIIAMSMTIREGGRLTKGAYGESHVISRGDVDAERILLADQVLVGLNKTRQAYNSRIRTLLGRKGSVPEAGDKLVCLRNNRSKRLLNGGLWQVDSIEEVKPVGVRMLVTSDDHIEQKPTEVFVRHEFFDGRDEALTWDQRQHTDEFTYGYALTTHKSQGSQWDDVIVFDESASFREDRSRWLYTAVTRAAEKITVVLP
jgi:exodeoxyribonuclease-5